MYRLAPIAIFVALFTALLPSSAGAAGFVGITSEDAYGVSGSYPDQTFAAQRKAGISLVRQTFDWSIIEQSAGTYDFRFQDRFVLAAAKRGVTVLPVLFNPPRFRSSNPNARGTAPPKSNAA